MAKSLRKILRLRELDEEVCRLKLTNECELLNRIEKVLDINRAEKQESQLIIFRGLSAGVVDERAVAEGVSKIADLRIESLKEHWIEQQARVAEQRQLYLESSIRKTQLARLLSDKELARKEDELRRQQLALDDWFNNSKRPDGGSRS